MSRSNYDHQHTYTATNVRRKSYRCTVPDCPHSIAASHLLNRKAACSSCGNEITVTAEHLRRSNITCINTGCAKKFAPNLPIHLQPDYNEAKTSATSLLDKLGLSK